MKILITGAGGRIGQLLRADLAEHDLRLLARSPIEDAAEEVVIGDVSDLEAIRPAFVGVESVIHLAAASEVGSDWRPVLSANIEGARNVLEAARLEGVPQLIYASTTHTVAGHERAAAPQVYELEQQQTFGIDIEPRPDSLYGASKVFGEALGRWYSDAHGLRVICLRIGYVSGRPDSDFESPYEGEEELDPGELKMRKRMRAIWLSRRDCARLFRAALASDARWAVVYATSDNPRQIWDLEPARRLIGFEPLDSAPR
ncbi:MAG TPA: NAD(P)-dependent oxidoreductase [Candidatus Limnocylindrales bacterium]|jgi:NAD+ dependent glucose-6-phosphate dehydrogenase|nr:NAD(P)-dependent oxidoreductase [Candidatus Limnocylindrales bacterium]